MPKYNILTLEIENETVESIRIFGSNQVKQQVEEFKKAYNLSKGDNYVFYLVMQSKMNKPENDFVNNKL